MGISKKARCDKNVPQRFSAVGTGLWRQLRIVDKKEGKILFVKSQGTAF